MEENITATEAVREFATILSRIRFNGDRFIIKRSGKPVAQMIPIKEAKYQPLKELKRLLNELPRLDEELKGFAVDLDVVIKEQPPLPQERVWE